MSLQKLPSEESLTFTERHPVLTYAWEQTWHFSKGQILMSGLSSLLSVPVLVALGALDTLLSWPTVLAVLFVYGGLILLTAFFNFCRAPFVLLAKLYRQTLELSQRMDGIETRPEQAAVTSTSIRALMGANNDPVLKCERTEEVSAYRNERGAIIEGPPPGGEVAIRALVVVVENDVGERVGRAESVSARLIYFTEPSRETLHEFNHGAWLSEERATVDLDVNSARRLVIATIEGGDKPQLFAVRHDDSSLQTDNLTRKAELHGKAFMVTVRFIAEGEGKLLKRSWLRFVVSHTPQFKAELDVWAAWRRKHVRDFCIEGERLRQRYKAGETDEQFELAVNSWEEKTADFLYEGIGSDSYKTKFLSDPRPKRSQRRPLKLAERLDARIRAINDIAANLTKP